MTDKTLCELKAMRAELQQLLSAIVAPVNLTQNQKLILLSLPSHLIKTYFTLESLGSAKAEEVSNLTHKARAVESSYLNQLATMGYATKTRKSRTTLFTVKEIKGQDRPLEDDILIIMKGEYPQVSQQWVPVKGSHVDWKTLALLMEQKIIQFENFGKKWFKDEQKHSSS